MKSTSFVTLFPALLKVNLSKPPSKMSLRSLTQLITPIRIIKRKTFIISLLLLSGVLFTIVFKALVNKDPYLIAVKELQDQKASQKGLLNKNNNSLALKVEALTASPSKEQALPHKTYLISRERCTQKVFLLVMVFSRPAYFDRRSVIRKTWATDPSMKTRWKTVFLLGQTPDDSVQNEYLEAEGMMHRDLIRGAQKENYYNLTLKTQMGLEWASKYCDFQYLLKADDDVFVNPHLLMDYLRKPDTPKKKLYRGTCRYGKRPFRRGKYGVSLEEYNRTTYPGFCNGPAYLLSSDMVHKLVEMFDISKKPFKLEDVYIGLLVEKMGDVKAWRHFSFRYSGECKLYPNTFTQHRASVQCMEKLHNIAMKDRLEYDLTKTSNDTKH